MDSIVLYNQNGQKFDVEVIRYFGIGHNKYLIFSLDEIDNNGYIQLYLSKVDDSNEKITMSNVTDDKEWNDFRNAIQQIVSNNKNGIPNKTDLDYHVLNEAMVSEFRIFKLKNDIAKSLSSNKNVENKTEKSLQKNMDLQSASAHDTGLTIEEILKEVSDGARNAREVTKVDLNKKDEEPTLEKTKENKAKKMTIEDLLNSEAGEIEPAIEENLEKDSDVAIEKNEDSDVTYDKDLDEVMQLVERFRDENIALINENALLKAKLSQIEKIIKEA